MQNGEAKPSLASSSLFNPRPFLGLSFMGEEGRPDGATPTDLRKRIFYFFFGIKSVFEGGETQKWMDSPRDAPDVQRSEKRRALGNKIPTLRCPF